MEIFTSGSDNSKLNRENNKNLVGVEDGCWEGCVDGSLLGLRDGWCVGCLDGCEDGFGVVVGRRVG